MTEFIKGEWYEWKGYYKDAKTGLRYFKFSYSKDRNTHYYTEYIQVNGELIKGKSYINGYEQNYRQLGLLETDTLLNSLQLTPQELTFSIF